MLIAMHGTWNLIKDGDNTDRRTNVHEIFDRYDGLKVQFDGIGSRFGLPGKLFGGIAGVGGKHRVREALGLASRYPGEVIDICGFSRGAATSLQLAVELSAIGRRVRSLMLFDCVPSFGIPIKVGPLPFNRWNPGYTLLLPKGVDYCFHAIAIHENRNAFRPQRIAWSREVWFRGGHSDVGGGNGNVGLSNISLRWMISVATHWAALPLTNDVPLVETNPDANPRLVFPHGRFHREVAAGDRVHISALRDVPARDDASLVERDWI